MRSRFVWRALAGTALTSVVIVSLFWGSSVRPARPPSTRVAFSERAQVYSWLINGVSVGESLTLKPGEEIRLDVELGDFQLERDVTLALSGKTRRWDPRRDPLDIWIEFAQESPASRHERFSNMYDLFRDRKAPKGTYRYSSRIPAPLRTGEYEMRLAMQQRIAGDFRSAADSSGEFLKAVRVIVE